MATEQEELENLKKNSPYALPDDPASSGWTTAQIKEKFYAGLLVLYGYLKVERDRIDTLEIGGVPEITEKVNKIINGQITVDKSKCDKNGHDIVNTYAKISDLASGLVTCLKYLKEDGTTTENIWQIEKNLNNFISSYNTFIATYFVNGKAKNAINAENVEKAMKDDLGNIIKNTYATIANLNITNAEITKIKNGMVTVGKAYNDQDGNLIPNTYIKIANIINNLTSSDTNKPLSAYQGKQLKAMIDTIQTLLASNDVNLDTVQEIVNYIKANRSVIETYSTSKMGFTDLITDWNSNLNNKPLAASVAYALKQQIDTAHTPKEVTIAVSDWSSYTDSSGNTAWHKIVDLAGQLPFSIGATDVCEVIPKTRTDGEKDKKFSVESYSVTNENSKIEFTAPEKPDVAITYICMVIRD